MPLSRAVLDRIQGAFPENQWKEAEAIISQYGESSSPQGQERVQLCALQLSEGNISKLQEMIEYAKRDYRDIIFWAENPSESRLDTPEKIEAFNKMLRRLGAKWQVENEDNDT